MIILTLMYYFICTYLKIIQRNESTYTLIQYLHNIFSVILKNQFFSIIIKKQFSTASNWKSGKSIGWLAS